MSEGLSKRLLSPIEPPRSFHHSSDPTVLPIDVLLSHHFPKRFVLFLSRLSIPGLESWDLFGVVSLSGDSLAPLLEFRLQCHSQTGTVEVHSGLPVVFLLNLVGWLCPEFVGRLCLPPVSVAGLSFALAGTMTGLLPTDVEKGVSLLIAPVGNRSLPGAPISGSETANFLRLS